ncbi:unnamed protein product [Gadus morhua 'NCC']
MRTLPAAPLLSALVFLATIWETKGAQASKDPCQPGFAQSFYSVSVSRDVAQGQHITKAPLHAFPCVCSDCNQTVH